MYRVAPCLQPMDPSAAEPWHSSSSLHTGATNGEVTGGGISPALPDAIVSLIWEKPRLIHPKNGHFLRVTDGLRNVFYVLSSGRSTVGLPAVRGNGKTTCFS